MEDILQAVSTVGFPIAIACYMMWSKHQNEKKQIEQNERQNILLNELKILIETLVK